MTPWTVGLQAPLSMGILQARILEWVARPSSRGPSQSRIELASTVLQEDSLTIELPGALYSYRNIKYPFVIGEK